ncbi:uncharacterized protein METZ01_LOCUS330642 [marine metagenome]|uniref:Uncharacterized protein n=1 Tax=marine metagenome TaxID=408172 RepID=A0A382PYT0_9ZZZZ
MIRNTPGPVLFWQEVKLKMNLNVNSIG